MNRHQPAAPAESHGACPRTADERWFSAEILPHERVLRAWLRGRFPIAADLDDVVQETYLRVLCAHRRRPITAARAFLFVTARNTAIGLLRHRRIAAEDAGVDLSACVDEMNQVAEAVERRQELELLTHAIATLPDRCREVFRLRKLEGLSQKAIAGHLGIAEHTVEAQIGHGTRHCAAFFARHGLPARRSRSPELPVAIPLRFPPPPPRSAPWLLAAS